MSTCNLCIIFTFIDLLSFIDSSVDLGEKFKFAYVCTFFTGSIRHSSQMYKPVYILFLTESFR